MVLASSPSLLLSSIQLSEGATEEGEAAMLSPGALGCGMPWHGPGTPGTAGALWKCLQRQS